MQVGPNLDLWRPCCFAKSRLAYLVFLFAVFFFAVTYLLVPFAKTLRVGGNSSKILWLATASSVLVELLLVTFGVFL